jgi:NAD(P)-dependent dehydrogenase (short-subunit alcohol dehydrogenase family)
MKLKDCVAVVTGAGSGIGRATAMSLARRGCHLALADIDPEGLEATGALLAASGVLGASGVRVSRHPLDVADREAVAAFPRAVLAAGHRGVDVLVNNAGVAVGGGFEEVAERDFDWLMEINFHGLVRMTRAFLPLLHDRPESRIVNVSSVFGLIAPPGQCAYSASKFAVRGFSNSLRHELLRSGVGVTVVHPGGVATAIARKARAPAGVPAHEVQAHVARFEKLLRMPPERAGEAIVRAVERRAARVVIGSDAKIAALLERLAPVGYWGLLSRVLRG